MPRPWLPTLLAAGLGSAALLAQPARTPAPPDAEITAWVRQLGDPDFHVRDSATRALKRQWPHALPAVRVATRSPDPEVAQRAGEVLRVLERFEVELARGRMRAATRDGLPDLFAEWAVRAAEKDPEAWQMIAEFGRSAVRMAQKAHGRPKAAPDFSYPSPRVPKGHLPPGPRVMRHDWAVLRTGTAVFLGGSLDVGDDAWVPLLAATGTVEAGRFGKCVFVANGPVTVREAALDSVVVCDGDFEVRPVAGRVDYLSGSLVVVRGNVRLPRQVRDAVVLATGDVRVPDGGQVRDSVVRAGGDLHLPEQAHTEGSKLDGNVADPTAPFPFFELSRFGLAVKSADDGVRVEKVEAKSPLAAAGLLKGDLVTAVDGKPVESVVRFRKQVRAAFARGDCALTVRRGADIRELLVRFPD